MESRTGRVKCVVWDLDRTLLPGVALERAGDGPVEPLPGVRDVLTTLAGRGILNSVASRNPPSVRPLLDALPVPFVAPQFGWGRKSESLGRIADELNIDLASLAFVDDDPYERAEVSFAHPRVVVLGPDEIADALTWPEFSPVAVTREGARRAQAYLDAQRRAEAMAEFGRDRAAFHAYCETTVTIWDAGDADAPRLHELSVRTSQFNSAGAGMPAEDLRARISSPGYRVVCLALADRFGDDGLVGCAVVSRAGWTVELLMMSCRAMGRGVIETLLAELAASALDDGATELRIPLRVNDRNVPLRLAMVSAGFRADNGSDPIFVRPVTPDSGPPAPPDWINIVRRS